MADTLARPTTRPLARPPLLPGFVLGVGFGGLVDGIVLHQLLQWHHMLSSVPGHGMTTVAGLRTDSVADGLFHAACWVVLLAGTLMGVREWQRRRPAPSWRQLAGVLLAGWGAFDVVEGLVDHEILGIHHVRDDLGSPVSWDLGFLAFGAALGVVGWLLMRHAGRR